MGKIPKIMTDTQDSLKNSNQWPQHKGILLEFPYVLRVRAFRDHYCYYLFSSYTADKQVRL